MRNPKNIPKLLLTLLLLLSSTTAWAVPAAPDLSTVTQPDGTIVEVFVRGDEWQNWVETKKGHTIARDAATKKWLHVKRFQGKEPVLSDVPAEKIPSGQLKKHIKPERTSRRPDAKNGASLAPGDEDAASSSESAPSMAPIGNFSGSVLFILAEFDDKAGSTTEESWANFLSNNIADFYNTASYGAVILSPAQETSGTANNGVINWVNVGTTHPNTGSSTGTDNRLLTREAILAADDYIDYSAYDLNSDGYVDNDELAVVVIVAGYERSYSATYTPNIWGHKWSISSADVPTVDGVKVGDYNSGAGGYAQFGEVHQSTASDGHQATMGIMIHEIGHLIFGFPDLYDTDSSSSGIGAYCVMASGSWGKKTGDTYSGETPVLPSAWIKHTWQWVNSDTTTDIKSITAAGYATADADNSVVKMNTEDPAQYFLVENRQALGYDRGLERWLGTSFGGLAIFHIDDSKTSNEEDTHRLVDLEEANGVDIGTEKGSADNLWYSGNTSSSNPTTFDSCTTPNNKLYDVDIAAQNAIIDISASQSIMTADLQADTTNCATAEFIGSWDFTDGLPADWSVSGTTAGWRFDDPGNRTNFTGGSGKFAIADSWNEGSVDIDSELLTSVLDLSNYIDVTLVFKSDFFRYAGGLEEVADVDVSTDGGSNWTNVWQRTGSDDRGPVSYPIDISAIADGQSNVTVRFHYYNANWENWWQVDDVALYGTPVAAPIAVCGDGYELPAEQWRMISLPCDPGANNTVSDLFADDISGDYDSAWFVWERDESTDSYVQLAPGSALKQGPSYWIYSLSTATLDFSTGTETATPLTISADCPEPGCFEIPLTKPATTESASLYNMAGHPLLNDTAWGDVIVKVETGVGTDTYTPANAELNGYISKTIFKYSGSTYDTYDDVTTGMIGTNQIHEGFWVKLLPGKVDQFDTVSLLVPAEGASLFPLQVGEQFNPEQKEEGWYVRITAQESSGGMIDNGSVFGRLPDSAEGYDFHDLPKMSPVGNNFLSVSFPHSDWEEYADDYASDFRSASSRKRRNTWSFEVYTDDPQREVTLSFAGPNKVLYQSRLVDDTTGKIIKVRPGTDYTFIMEETVRSFTWNYFNNVRRKRE